MKPQSIASQKTYRFVLDGKHFESAQRYITGSQLRAMAGIAPEFRIFLEKHREENIQRSHPPDREIGDAYTVDLAEPGEEVFYTLHQPTMDIN